MTAPKTLAAISLATAFLATTSAWAQPAGSEYLPKVPQNPTHQSGGSASSTGESTTTTGVTSDGSAKGSGSSSNRRQKQGRKKPATAKPAKLTPAAADTSGAGDTLPIVLLVAVGVMVLVVGVVLRRRSGYRSGSWRN